MTVSREDVGFLGESLALGYVIRLHTRSTCLFGGMSNRDLEPARDLCYSISDGYIASLIPIGWINLASAVTKCRSNCDIRTNVDITTYTFTHVNMWTCSHTRIWTCAICYNDLLYIEKIHISL